MIRLVAVFVVRFPLIVVWAAVGLTVVAIYFAYQGASLRVSLEEMLPYQHQNVKLQKEFGSRFGGVNTILVAIERLDGDVYDVEFLEKYRRISDEVYFHPDNQRPLFNALNLRKTRAVFGAGGSVQIEPVMWPDIPRTPEALDRFRQLVKGQFDGYFVSADEHALMIVAEFKEGLDYSAVLDFFQNLRAEEENETTKIYIVGRPVLLGLVSQALPGMILIFLLSIAVICLVLFVYFRNTIGIVVPLVVALCVTIWGFGVIGYYEYNLDPLLLLLPFFVFATVLSHSVQFISRVFEELDNHEDMRDAVRGGLERLLYPSTAAILTDAAGFTVLVLIAIPSIQSLALICTLWLLSLTPALILAGAVLALMKRPKKYSLRFPGMKLLWAISHPGFGKILYLPIFVAILIGGWSLSRGLQIGDAVGSPILWPTSRYNTDVTAINSRFSMLGTDVFQVYISGDSNTMLLPEVYHRVEALDRYVFEHVPEATPAQSLVPIVKRIHSVLWEGDPSYELVPDSPEEIGFDIYMFRSRGEPGDFAAYTDLEWQIGRIAIFTSEHSSETVDALMRESAAFKDNVPREQDTFEFLYAGGQLGLVKAVNDEIRTKNDLLLLSIVTVILVNILFYYRSFALAGIVVFVLASSHFVTMGVMAKIGVGLNLNTLPLAALGLGRGVDYSIYMIDRIRQETRNGAALVPAAREAFFSTGIAVVVTALTMVLPLLPWYLISPLKFQAEMGLLLAIILVFNMLGALLVVPAAIGLFRPRGFFKAQVAEQPQGAS